MMNFKIRRPPLLKSFELPSYKELLKVKVGMDVKLAFTDIRGENGERMWVKVKYIDRDKGEFWQGTLDNVPFSLKMKLGQIIPFHPLDIIDITS